MIFQQKKNVEKYTKSIPPSKIKKKIRKEKNKSRPQQPGECVHRGEARAFAGGRAERGHCPPKLRGERDALSLSPLFSEI